MSRPVLLFAVLALTAGVTSHVDAKPRPAKTVKAAKAKKSKRQAKKDSRVPTRTTKPNMPRGFVWPPTRGMAAMGERCVEQLDEQGVAHEEAKPVGRVVTPMTLPEGQIGGITYTPAYSRNQTFDCQLVLALANFAPRLYELGVREVKFGSAYRWSKVRVGGRTKNMLSRHGLGIALDIVSFTDESGREAVVARDYKQGDELLLAIEQAVNESGGFRLLLTPKNDPKSHKDHFHLEANPDYTEARQDKPQS